MKSISIALISICLSFSALGQSDISKGDWVVPKFDADMIEYKFKLFVGLEAAISVSEANPGSLSLNGDLNWREKFPKLREYKIHDLKVSKKSPTEIVLRNDSITSDSGIRKQIKLLVPPNLELQKTLSSLLFRGTSSEFIKSEYFSALQREHLARIFTGSLRVIPFDQQKKLHTWAKYEGNVFRESVFKNKTFFSVTTNDDFVYNTIQLNLAERTARTAENSLKILREIFSITGRIGGFDGIRVQSTISSYDFVRKDDVKEELFELYVSFDILQKFLDADITNQDLIENATVLVDGSRMRVNLTTF